MMQNIKTYISENKTRITVYIVLIVGSFTLGRYTVPETVRIKTKTVEVEKKNKDEKKENHKKRHKETTKTEKDNKDGTKDITIKIVEDDKSDSDSKINEKDQKDVQTDTSTEIVHNKFNLNLSLLGGVSILHPEQGFVYGGSVSTKLIGPTTLGAWGLSNGTAGLSLGVVF